MNPDERIRQLEQELKQAREELTKVKLQRYSYCNIHQTYPREYEPCWECINRMSDILDLQCDEFKRIVALNPSPEIVGLCERAVKNLWQTIPLIKQRDNLQSQLSQWQECAREMNKALYCWQQRYYNVEHGAEFITGKKALALFSRLFLTTVKE